MRRNTKLITTILTMVMVLPLFLGLGSAKDVMATDSDLESEVTEQMVTLHKLKFTGEPTLKQNTGNELTEKELEEMFPGGTALQGSVFTSANKEITLSYYID